MLEQLKIEKRHIREKINEKADRRSINSKVVYNSVSFDSEGRSAENNITIRSPFARRTSEK